MKFKTYPLGTLYKRVTSGGTPKSTKPEYYGGDIPWLNTKEINFNRIYVTERCISKLGLENSSAKWIIPPAVIVAMYGATVGKVATGLVPLTTNQACCNMEIDAKKADFRFIYYYLRWKYRELASLANGGAQQNLSAQLIKEFPVMLPSLVVQRPIAETLWKIDDKIELNQKINENLERQAQVMFQELFIDNALPDWESGTISDLGAVVGGSTPSKTSAEYYTDKGIAWITPKDLSANKSKFISHGENDIERVTRTMSEICQVFVGGFAGEDLDLQPQRTVLLRGDKDLVDIFIYEFPADETLDSVPARLVQHPADGLDLFPELLF